MISALLKLDLTCKRISTFYVAKIVIMPFAGKAHRFEFKQGETKATV